ncbi:hypothetical protein BDZ94DRAFT_779932 [Collybia nuda]|uniref:ZZ-type domain-containing protein n=1 Tax=Collybia nuda TaxID=64659 RepID=A0A9P5YIP8_9AGAR|nr:hypothetical protein BDZ94DRAFT_779932 [Collybia nuda]
MTSNSQGYFPNILCNFCDQIIAPSNPRVRCQVCQDYDLCANCALADRFNDQHIASHTVQLFKQSGYFNGEGSILSRNTIVFAQFLPYVTSPSSPGYVSGLPSSLPLLLPRSPRVFFRNSPSPRMADQQWQPFFLPDMTPTLSFMTLLDDIFSYLDSPNSGYLYPEAYSLFLEDLGYLGQENSWKANYIAVANVSAELMADRSLKSVFDLFSIDHDIQQRIQPTYVDPSGTTLLSEGPMPLLTRKGFLDITTLEVLGDPSRQWANFSRLIRKYNLPRYRGWGDLPRSVLPELPDPGTLQKIAAVEEVAKANAARDLASAQAAATRELATAQAVAMLQVQASQQVADLFNSDREYYRYY